MEDTRLQVLTQLDAGTQTGPELADLLGISRTAVWKHIEALRTQGFEIETGESGYELTGVPEYGGAAVQLGLDVPYRVAYHETVESTNDIARDLAESGERDVVVLSDEQTGGRGRQKRAWTSPSGGIWMSIIVEPDLPSARAPLLTLAAAVAVVRGVESVGVDATIKWPNDVLVTDDSGQERKLAGILTEMAGEADRVDWVIVGIGLNANVDRAAVGEGATTLREEVGGVDRRMVVQRILEAFHEQVTDPDSIREAWIDRSSTLGREVRVETATEVIEGRADSVTDVGALVVETAEGTQTVHAGDCEHLRPLE